MEQDDGKVRVEVFTKDNGAYTKDFDTVLEARTYLQATKEHWFDFSMQSKETTMKKEQMPGG